MAFDIGETLAHGVYLWAEDPKVHRLADWRIDSLTELPALIEAARA